VGPRASLDTVVAKIKFTGSAGSPAPVGQFIAELSTNEGSVRHITLLSYE